MAAVNVVRRLSRLVGAVQQAAIFGVSKEELGQAATAPTNSDVEGCVSFLEKQKLVVFIKTFIFIYTTS